MHPQPVGERSYGNSFGFIENDDVGVGHCWSHRSAAEEPRRQTIWGETLPGFLLLPAILLIFAA
jgi:hypothetical protein